jgi:glycosyltransferase involved in cell wall biosynthesis
MEEIVTYPYPKSGTAALNHRAMVERPVPLFSVIIAVYNDWMKLDGCLQSLVQQSHTSSFEVIVVDDGGDAPAGSLGEWADHYPLTVIRQAHAGISAARNRGIKSARGSVLVFVDADCRLQADCLAALATAVALSPRQNCFQLQLVGDCSRLVGRAETLRLAMLQDQLLQPDGCIRYLDTAGAAIRRTRVDVEQGLFDLRARRGEDTILLAKLIRDGELPLFVAGAIVQHAVSLSLMRYVLKEMRATWAAAPAYDIIASMGVNVRISHRQRLKMLRAIWKLSGQYSMGNSALVVTIVRQTLGRVVFRLYRFARQARSLYCGTRFALHRSLHFNRGAQH